MIKPVNEHVVKISFFGMKLGRIFVFEFFITKLKIYPCLFDQEKNCSNRGSVSIMKNDLQRYFNKSNDTKRSWFR